jgi:hypothetical protein
MWRYFSMRQIRVLILLLASLSAAPLSSQSRELPIDWLLLIDTSQSMVGRGGSANIFAQVQRALKAFVRRAKYGDSVAIYTFDSRVVPGQSILLGNQDDKRRLFEQIDSLKPEGLFTHTGEAFYSALLRQEELHPLGSEGNRKGFIVLMTDGIEDTRDRPQASRLSDIEIPPRNKRPYSIIVWLGRDVEEFTNSPLSSFASSFGDKAQVLLHPQAKDIDGLVTELRQIASKEARNRIDLETRKVDFGTLQPDLGSKSEEKEIVIYAEQEARFGYLLEDPRIEVVKPVDAIHLIPGENRIPFVFRVIKEGEWGEFTSKLVLERLDAEDNPILGTVAVTYEIAKPSYTAEILLLLVSTGVLWLLLQRWRIKRRLFGILDVTNRAGGVAPIRIDLWSLKRPRARLAELLGRPSLDGDAELSVGKHENGNRAVRLSQAKGPVSLNDKPLGNDSVEEIYNGDRLALGDNTTIRYSGPERPELSEELRQIDAG